MIDTTPKTFIFVLMPLSTEFDDTYKLGIKDACKEAGAYCERVDEQIFEESILERIYNQISKADLLVADMTGRNPNVFYEVGYAHALGKRVILLTRESEDIPFDLKHYPHIVYGGRITELKEELKKRIKWAIDNPRESKVFFKTSIEFYVEEVLLVDNPVITMTSISDRADRLSLRIAVHNSTRDLIETASFQVGVITPTTVSDAYSREEHPRKLIKLGDNKFLHVLEHDFMILPGSWDRFYFSLIPYDDVRRFEDSLSITMRSFSVNGVQDYPFSIELVRKPTTTSP